MKIIKNNKYESLSKPQKELDFHNKGILKKEEIIDLLENFIKECKNEKIEKALIITGKGIHSKDGRSIVRPIVENELSKNPEIKNFYESRIDRGGSGAIEVIFI